MTIGVVDYGAGNLRNVQAALTGLGVPWRSVARPEDLPGLEGLILPGVGRFGAAANRLAETGLAAPIREQALAGRPLLGICLGMQLLFEGSEEDGEGGLGLLPGRVGRLPAARLPHIGWAVVRPRDPEAAGGLFRGLPAAFHAYFAHSYAVPAGHPAAEALTSCPPAFTSAVAGGGAGRRFVLGVQFHPEKSGADGRRILANFAALV
ncbi:MAG: imidazole glycerol phosphate synthase subunit HisH, partial [Candidatus Polarisedimenticolia bacterium]